MLEPTQEVDAVARSVIGAAIEVHRYLGPGFLENVYEEALAVELALRNIPFQGQHSVGVTYKGVRVGDGKLDFLVAGSLVVELKAVDALLPVHRAQVISYLKATQCSLGLLINFKALLLKDGIERIILSQ